MQSLLNGPPAAPSISCCAATAPGVDGHATPAPDDARTVGKYLVSPLIRGLENGWFASSVSIRSGSGSGTTDRVLRLTRMFRCATDAAVYAHAEGLRWISASRGPRLATIN